MARLRGFEPPTFGSRRQLTESYLVDSSCSVLYRAVQCDFTRCSAPIGPKLDPSLGVSSVEA